MNTTGTFITTTTLVRWSKGASTVEEQFRYDILHTKITLKHFLTQGANRCDYRSPWLEWRSTMFSTLSSLSLARFTVTVLPAVERGVPKRCRRGLNRKACSVDVLAWSTLFAVEVSPRVEDMGDRCCCGTVLIGAVVTRHTASVRLDDSSAGWTTYRSFCSAQYQERRTVT